MSTRTQYSERPWKRPRQGGKEGIPGNLGELNHCTNTPCIPSGTPKIWLRTRRSAVRVDPGAPLIALQFTRVQKLAGAFAFVAGSFYASVSESLLVKGARVIFPSRCGHRGVGLDSVLFQRACLSTPFMRVPSSSIPFPPLPSSAKSIHFDHFATSHRDERASDWLFARELDSPVLNRSAIRSRSAKTCPAPCRLISDSCSAARLDGTRPTLLENAPLRKKDDLAG